MANTALETLKISIAAFLKREFDCDSELDYSDLSNVTLAEEDVGMDEDFDPEAFHITIMLDLSNPNRCYWRYLVNGQPKLVQEDGSYEQLAEEFENLTYEEIFSDTYDLYDNKWGDLYDEVSIVLARSFKMQLSVAVRTLICEALKEEYINCGFCIEELPVQALITGLMVREPKLFLNGR